MKADSAPTSIADYCQQLILGSITVNKEWQREDKIWSSYVRSYFIESLLLEYPIPKLFLYVKFDLKTRTSKKEIVDGQQRSQALRLFYENKMQISSRIETEDLKGKKYRDLSPEYQAKFLSYSLPIDEFRGVGEDEIRESFARMNVHNVSLNGEEVRHAKFQGPFKHFILRMARAFREQLLEAGVLSRRDIIRMADARMFADIAIILDAGFSTTKPEDIDSLYKKYDDEFLTEAIFQQQMSAALNEWYDQRLFDYTELTSKHVFYCLIAAMVERNNPGAVLKNLNEAQVELFERIQQQDCSLQQLNDDIASFKAAKAGEEEPDLKYANFVAACTVKTNVSDEKLIRFAYLTRALQ